MRDIDIAILGSVREIRPLFVHSERQDVQFSGDAPFSPSLQ